MKLRSLDLNRENNGVRLVVVDPRICRRAKCQNNSAVTLKLF